jgi:hypothetical protein
MSVEVSNQAWGAVQDRLADLEEALRLVLLLERGCDCEQDYRCGRCQLLIDAVEAAKAALGVTP